MVSNMCNVNASDYNQYYYTVSSDTSNNIPALATIGMITILLFAVVAIIYRVYGVEINKSVKGIVALILFTFAIVGISGLGQLNMKINSGGVISQQIVIQPADTSVTPNIPSGGCSSQIKYDGSGGLKGYVGSKSITQIQSVCCVLMILITIAIVILSLLGFIEAVSGWHIFN